MLFDNGSLRIQGENLRGPVSISVLRRQRILALRLAGTTYFQGTSEGIHETGEEDQSSTLEEAFRSIFQIEEDTADDKRHDTVSDESL